MKAYIEPIASALVIFPFVALLFTLPYMFYQYRKYGAILMLRTLVIYSFILYFMCAYFLTMLPLPSIEHVRQLTTPTMQLIPFYDWYVWIQHSHLVLTQPSTWKGLLNRDLFQLVANIAMTVPLGIYLRYYFRCSLKKTVLLSFCASLLFELTQLSGLFFIYPRPYRLFETDDLITNTFGGLLGYWMVGPLMKLLPSHERMDEVAYRRSNHVSVTRRLTAAIADWLLIGVLSGAATVALHMSQLIPTPDTAWGVLWAMVLVYATCVILYFMVGEWLQHGYTPGKRLMRLRLIDDRDGSRPKLWQCVVRYAILYLIVAPMPAVALLMLVFMSSDADGLNVWEVALCAVLLAIFAAFVILVVIRVLTHSNQLPHGELSKTRNISTLVMDADMADKVGEELDASLYQEELPEEKPGETLNG